MNRSRRPHITKFSLGDLIDLSGESHRAGILRECVIANSETGIQAFRFPCRIDAFVFGVGCEGETNVTINHQQHTLRKDTMVVVTPQHTLQIQSDGHFRAHMAVISTDLMRRLNVDRKYMLPLLVQFSTNPQLNLSPIESNMLRSIMTLIDRESEQPEGLFTQNIILKLLSAMLYKVGSIIHHHLDTPASQEVPVNSRTEDYLRRFTQLLGENFKQERRVGFYAEILGVSPKYLTTLIKRISNRSATEWIDSYVIVEAKTLIKYSNMSMQEIAYYLNFTNQSFFGSYFKRNTGMSPTQYKAMI